MFRIRAVALALALIFEPFGLEHGGFARAQSPAPAAGTSSTEQRKTSEPYTGDLSVFDSPGREERLQINRVMDVLGIAQGKSVADIGAGSGWFTVRAARRVGTGGLVYAVDINSEAIRYIGDRAHKEQLQNVKTIVGKPGRSSTVCRFGRCGAAAQDLSRGSAAGDVIEEPAGGAASGREGGSD